MKETTITKSARRINLLRPSWIARHLFAGLIIVMLVSLGFWQLDRLEERRARNAERLASAMSAPIAVANPSDMASLVGRRVQISGSYRHIDSVVLRNQRNRLNENGLALFTPLELADGQLLMVHRGWIPPDQLSPADWLPYALVGEQQLEGVVRPAQTRADALLAPYDLPLPGESRIEAWIRPDLAKMDEQIDGDLLPVYLELLPDPAADPAAFPQPLDPSIQDEGPHLGYAIQWFAFAAMLVVVYAALMRQVLRGE